MFFQQLPLRTPGRRNMTAHTTIKQGLAGGLTHRPTRPEGASMLTTKQTTKQKQSQ